MEEMARVPLATVVMEVPAAREVVTPMARCTTANRVVDLAVLQDCVVDWGGIVPQKMLPQNMPHQGHRRRKSPIPITRFGARVTSCAAIRRRSGQGDLR